MGLLLVGLALSYSRGALLALVVGLAIWFIAVPLRLRSLGAIGAATLCALPVVVWTFNTYALTTERLGLPIRGAIGYDLGIILIVMCAVLLAAGICVNFWTALAPPKEIFRQWTGRVIVCGMVAVALTGIIVVAASPGGITGRAWHTWTQMTNPDVRAPGNTPGRLTASSSVRAQYWKESRQIFSANTELGTGAGSFAVARMPYRANTLFVRHSHGYVFQTMADLGIAGLAASLFVLLAWGLSALRATGLRPRDRGIPFDAQRIGRLTLFMIAIIFGIHSLLDWTWFVPVNAAVGLLCAGFLVGLKPLRAARRAALTEDASTGDQPSANKKEKQSESKSQRLFTFHGRSYALPGFGAWAGAGLVLIFGLSAAWATIQPVRSLHAEAAAMDHVKNKEYDSAQAAIESSIHRNPLADLEPLWELAAIESARGHETASHKALQRAVVLQPKRADTWRRLGQFQLSVLHKNATP